VSFFHVVFRRINGGANAAIEEVHDRDVPNGFPGFLLA
jgi:hypothetical protein